jgi:hypothetical protein
MRLESAMRTAMAAGGDGMARLADRLRFLIANPAVRKAAGQAAKRRVRDHCQWPQIAVEIERIYFQMMGWEWAATPSKRPSGRVFGAAPATKRRAG